MDDNVSALLQVESPELYFDDWDLGIGEIPFTGNIFALRRHHGNVQGEEAIGLVAFRT